MGGERTMVAIKSFEHKKMDHNEEQNEEKIQNLNHLQCVGRSQHYKNLDD